MTHDEMIAVLEAARRGQAVESGRPGSGLWSPEPRPTWDFSLFDYRVAAATHPAMPDEVWLSDYPGRPAEGVMAAYPDEEWARRGRNCIAVRYIRAGATFEKECLQCRNYNGEWEPCQNDGNYYRFKP